MQPIHAWRAYTDKLRGDSRHAGTSYAGVLPGSTADGLLANLVVLSHLRAIPNSDRNSLREFRTFGRSQVSVLGLWFINGLGRAIHHPECVHMSHGMLLFDCLEAKLCQNFNTLVLSLHFGLNTRFPQQHCYSSANSLS